MTGIDESGRLALRRRWPLVVAVALGVVYASPALAEVCDKADSALPLFYGLVLGLAAACASLAAIFGILWPSYLAAGFIALLVAADISDLISADPVATAMWREGCMRTNLAVTVISGVALIVLSRWARNYHVKR